MHFIRMPLQDKKVAGYVALLRLNERRFTAGKSDPIQFLFTTRRTLL